jgi:hypothetical protein
MLSELVARDRMTNESYAVIAIPMRVGEIASTPLVSDAFPVEAEAEEPARPIQSAGSSLSSGGIQKKLYSALAGFAELASHWFTQLWVTYSPGVRAANMLPWTAKNLRRIRLIEKKHEEGLNAQESEELARLKREVSAHLQRVAPRSTDVVDEFAERVRKLTEKAAAKKTESR